MWQPVGAPDNSRDEHGGSYTSSLRVDAPKRLFGVRRGCEEAETACLPHNALSVVSEDGCRSAYALAT